MSDTVTKNSYSEYCKGFTKGLKTAINKHKGPCPAKEFDAMITEFVTNLYSNPTCSVAVHPFATEQDAYNFAYSVIFTITSTTSMSYDDFKDVVKYTTLPEQFIHDMFIHIMERKNSVKKLAEQVNSSATKLTEIRTVCTGLVTPCNSTTSTPNSRSCRSVSGTMGLELSVGGNEFEVIKNTQLDGEQTYDNKETKIDSVKDEPNSYCCVM